jgi:nucleotide-binding universal stress UspA family protein
MKRILLSVDFTPVAGQTLQYVSQLAEQLQWKVDLLHCFPLQTYNRAYDFGEKDYATGIQELLLAFHQAHSQGATRGSQYLAKPGSIVEVMPTLKPKYGLLAIGGSKADQDVQVLGGRAISVAASVNCPVLIVPPTAHCQPWEKVWYLQRTDYALDRLVDRLRFLGITPQQVQGKTFTQKNFYSALWERIVKRRYNGQADWERPLDETISLVVLVRDQKQQLMDFLRGEAIEILYGYQIPILILQTTTNR